MKSSLYALLMLMATTNASLGQGSRGATLEIRFKGIRNQKGLIAVGISRSKEGWPHKPYLEYSWEKTHLKGGVLTTEVKNLTCGTYALAALDDENRNLEMDRTLGIPREGWGFSRNPPFKLTAPDFGECAFRVDDPVTTITIEMRYAGKGR